MNGIKGILFDFGGTLDTNGTHWGIMLQDKHFLPSKTVVAFSLSIKLSI